MQKSARSIFLVPVLLVVTTLATSLTAMASEADVYCNLARTEARIASEVLAAPSWVGTAGSANSSDQMLAIGVSKSWSRARQASLTNLRADEQCAAYRAHVEFAAEIKGASSRIALMGLRASKEPLLAALAAAEANLKKEQALLATQDATLADVKVALDTRDRIQLELAGQARREAELTDALPAPRKALADLATESLAAQTRAAELGYRLTAASAWDFTLQAGVQRNMTTGAQAPFVGVNWTRSFGQGAAEDATVAASALNTRLLTERREGELAQLERLRASFEAALAAERTWYASLDQRQQVLEAARAPLPVNGSVATQRFLRSVNVECLMLKADLLASSTRVEALQAWLALNGAGQ